MMKTWLLVLCISIACCVAHAQNTDSLVAIYNNTKLPDTVRLKAIETLAWGNIYINPEQARTYAQRELEFSQKKRNQLYEARAYNTLACVYHVLGKYPTAIKYHKLSLRIRIAIKDDTGIAASLSNLGSEYLTLSDYPTAVDYFQQSLKVEQKLNNPSSVASCYNNLGLLYESVGEASGNHADYQRAIDYYEKSLAITEKTGDKGTAAATLGNLGNIYEHHFKQLDKALSYQKKSVISWRQAGNIQGEAQSYGNMGNIFQDMTDKELMAQGIDPVHKYDTAFFYYDRCYQMMKELGDINGMALSLSNKGWLYSKQGKYKEAIQILKQAIDLSHEIGDIDGEKESHELMYNAYRMLKDYKLSLFHYEIYINLRDSLYKQEAVNEVTRKELSFKYAQKAASDSLKSEKQRFIMHAQLEQEQTTRYYLFIGLGLVAVFALFIFNRFRVTKKQKNIIESQKVVVEEQNKKVLHQKALIEEKNKEVLDSIHYAKRLQEVILPPLHFWNNNLPNNFIYYKPKDIVAGDFYWMEKTGGMVLFAAADCTGHGVPGALVSVVCSNALNRAVKEFHLTVPGEILDKVRELVIETFRSSEHASAEVKDGMDISLIGLKFDHLNASRLKDSSDLIAAHSNDLKENRNDQVFKSSNIQIQWAGANNPLWIYHKATGEITEIGGDKQPIGFHHVQSPFTTHHITVQPGDRLFLFTDGFADQFGGEKGKKFKYSNLKKLLASLHDQPLQKFPEILDSTLNNWVGSLEQLDDICIMGVEL